MIQKVNLKAIANEIPDLFQYFKVGQLNDHMLNVVLAENRILDFHIHEESDEMFYVIEGKMQIELDDSIIDLDTGDFIIIPKGTRHRPVCKTLVKCLLIEKCGTLSKDNTGGTYKE
ncbi:MAG TPA: cupin domain-containing protein [Acetivibrio sp.]|uniref:cupin domain-containing protein n=1 Tax=Acetivibrio sp. TaxID=1872092 RepID=UPI002C8D3787|nr:cupin domain-containing protein [Acetivibrio sp.]HOM01893.1 cupin domain-containing protein [Acetivibrio sp.]